MRCTPIAAVTLLVSVAFLGASSAQAQEATPAAATAPPVILPAEQQVAAAVLPLPEELRAGATVLGYASDGSMMQLRAGTNGMICLADDPKVPIFHVACYHEGMEPFMARGRALRREGIVGPQVDSVRIQEITEGTLVMPSQPAALYSLTGREGSYDAATNEVTGGRPLYVVYLPFATEASTGIPTKPQTGRPWLMDPGTPKAHIMFIPEM